MAIYAIGDVQGCYTELCQLLEKINFDSAADRLWFCGDLVNRGPESLQTLRLVRSLGDSAETVLGNHDLHLLALAHGINRIGDCGSLQAVLDSPDREELLSWLQSRPLLLYDRKHKVVVVHAGIHPAWGLSKARKLAHEVEAVLQSERAGWFFEKMYGNKPRIWRDELDGAKRLRLITNVFTRMRYFDAAHKLDFNANGSPRQHRRQGLVPWYQIKAKLRSDVRIVFGHWSTLPVGSYGRCFALDGGCVWGGHLVALRIDNEAEDWYFVDSTRRKPVKLQNKPAARANKRSSV